MIPGHKVIGYTDAVGNRTDVSRLRERLGIDWIHSGDGTFAMGCYCDDENRCHQQILRDLREKLGTQSTQFVSLRS